MKFTMPQYECKYFNQGKWEDVSELEMLGDLIDSYSRITPVIQEIIKGRHILTPKAVYRLKLKA